ncbi:MAG TPA: polysaccharide deacetylase family protein, partial [Terriglobales bacterium]|nr:polysaccharide deacetylase family protein [Terriglobales bacterium]
MEALEKHWVTSASILVPCPWFPEVAQWAKTHPEADLGIHLALNSEWTTLRWRPVSPQPRGSSLLDADGYLPLTEDRVAKNAKAAEVEVETRAQIDKAIAAGIGISHLDAHMGAILGAPELYRVYLNLGKSYQLPLLLERPPYPGIEVAPGAMLVDRALGIQPGVPDGDWLMAYEGLLASLPPGVYQLTVHLGHDDEELQGATADHPNWGARWRQNDFDLVRNPLFQAFLQQQGFVLVSWRELKKAMMVH